MIKIPLELQLEPKSCKELVKLWNDSGEGKREVALTEHFYFITIGILCKNKGKDTYIFTELGSQLCKWLKGNVKL